MSEYIKRDSIIGLAHKLAFGRILTDREVEVVEMVVNSVHDDVRVDLVRCRECIHNYANMVPCGEGCAKCTEMPIAPDFFCKSGERRGGDE